MSAGDRDTLTELLREALKQQVDAVEGWHSPWVSDDATPEGLIQVDGDLDLRILADAILTSGWFRAAQAQAWDEGWNECVDHRDCTFSGPGECPNAPPNPYRSDD